MQGILLSSPPAGVGGFSLDKSRQKNFWGKFVVAWRRRGVTGGVTVCTARRRGLPFAPAKGSKTGSRGKFPLDKPLFVACSAGYERCEASSVLRTDTLQRCLRRIFIAPALERGRANHHPCPLLKGGELRGKQEDRERTAESIIKAAGLGKRTLGQEAPPPKRGRGTGWGQMRRCSLQASSR